MAKEKKEAGSRSGRKVHAATWVLARASSACCGTILFHGLAVFELGLTSGTFRVNDRQMRAGLEVAMVPRAAENVVGGLVTCLLRQEIERYLMSRTGFRTASDVICRVSILLSGSLLSSFYSTSLPGEMSVQGPA